MRILEPRKNKRENLVVPKIRICVECGSIMIKKYAGKITCKECGTSKKITQS